MRLLLLPILCLLLGVVTSELQTFQAGVALIGRYVINKTPSANPVQFIKSFMEPLIQAAQWPAENGIAPLEVMFGISGNMSMRISEETKKRLEEHLKHSKTTYAKFLKDSAALLERENDLKESLQNQLHLKLVTQIAAAQKVVSEYLEEPSDINKAKLIRKFEEPAMSQCGEEFTKSAELVMAQFFADQLQAKAYKYEDFEKIFQIVWRSRMELSSMAILYHTVKSNGDGRVVGNFLKDEQKQIQSLKALEKQWRRFASKLEFSYFAVNETVARFQEGQGLDQIYQKIDSHKWEDGTNYNDYFLLSYSVPPRMKRYSEYTYAELINNQTLILHRRSGNMAPEPASSNRAWYNWYPEELHTIEMEIRDSLDEINPVGKTLDELADIVHYMVYKKCGMCPSVITSTEDPMPQFYAEGSEKSPAGRIIKAFGRISIFIGF